MTTRLEIGDSKSTVVEPLPKVASGFLSYDVYIPENKPQEIRFFCGEVTEAGLPPEFDSFPLSPGQHQIVLHEQDGRNEDFRFLVYVDGQLAIDKNMGKQWMPQGWGLANGLDVRRRTPSSWIPLTGKQYKPKTDYEKYNYFNGSHDDLANWPGYQLWIDEVGRTPQSINDFVGFFGQQSRVIGLRDGPRLSNPSWAKSLALEFNHPAARSGGSVLAIEPEFIIMGKAFGSAKATGQPTSWKLSRSADKIEEIKYDESSTAQSHSIFLHATTPVTGNISPVIEFQWTKDRPNDVGLRLPDVAANAQVTRWRLRSIQGVRHLWRMIEHGDQSIDIRKFNEPADTNPTTTNAATNQVAIPLNSPTQGTHSLKWRTNITIPLQIFQRTSDDSQALLDLDLYRGLPFGFGYEPPTSAGAKAWVIWKDNVPLFETPIPGGRVIDEIVLELDAKDPSWTWLRLKPLEKNSSSSP